MSKTIIKNGRVIDPASKTDEILDIEITGNKITLVGKNIKAENCIIIDAKNKLVIPGLIDTHVHLREPGQEYKETIETGLRAAAKGGITSVCNMPNTTPVCDNEGILRYIIDKASKINLGRVFPVGAVTKGLEGKELSEIGTMKRFGAVALSDDGHSVSNSYILRRAMEYANTFNLTIIDHCEDTSLSGDGVMHEGYYSTKLGLRGIPSSSEEIIVARDVLLSLNSQIPIHIAHVSSGKSVELIKWAKNMGAPVTAEVTVHHLLLSDKDLVNYNTNLKVKPPLGSEEDRQSLLEGLKNGTIDTIVTDHAPHADIDKDVEFDYASFGMIGLETCLPLLLSSRDIKNNLSLSSLIEKMTINPARIFNLPGGKIAKNEPADITIVDVDKKVTIDKGYFESKSKNSPFIGQELKGIPECVLVDGKIILEKGKIKYSNQ